MVFPREATNQAVEIGVARPDCSDEHRRYSFGRLAALDLMTLEDDWAAIPPCDAVVIVGRSLRRARPDVVAALGELDGRIPVERMRASNLAVHGHGLF